MAYRSESGRPVRFGLVGCGRIAQAHLDALSHVENADLRVIAEPRAEAGQAAAERHKCLAVADTDDPRFFDGIDAAIVCAPPVYHGDLVDQCLERGVHVLCEKPFTLTSPEASSLVRKAHEKGLQLMMASKFRYVDDVVKAKSIIESGILGDLILYENTFCSRVAMHDRWNANRKISGGGVLIDNGSHSVDIARYLLGSIKEVQAQTGIPAQGLEVEDTVRLEFRTHGGVMGLVDLSWSINKESDYYISVFGTEGTLLVGWKGSRYRQEGNPNWVSFGKGYDKVAAFSSQLENFVGCILGQDVSRMPPEHALASVQVIESAYVSASRNDWVPVEPLVESLA